MSSTSTMSTNVKIAVIVLLVANIILTIYYNYKENYDECLRVDYDFTIKKLNNNNHNNYDNDNDSDSIIQNIQKIMGLNKKPQSVSETF